MIEVRFYAAAREAAGAGGAMVAAASVSELQDVLAVRHGEPMARLLPACTLLHDGRRLDADSPLPPGAIVEVLPPFAGG